MSSANKDLSLTQPEYERFQSFILERCGLHFSEDKRQLLSRGLAETLDLTGCSSLDQLYQLLHNASSTSVLWDQLVSTLTVGETYFFRNVNHWDALRQHILPALMAQRERSSRRIRIWCAGCATGEEPYSIAMLLREVVPNLESWNVFILATDLNREALRKAQQGQYGTWSFRGVDKHIQDTYFKFDGRTYAITDSVKRMVTFSYLNLVGDPFPSLSNNTNAMDIILCRNVTIYFTPQVTIDLVKRFHESLIDGGWLIPGPSEPNMVFYNDFESRNFPGTVVYQKTKSLAQQAPKPFDVFKPALTPSFVPVSPAAKAMPGTAKPLAATPPFGTIAARSTPSVPLDPFEVAQQLIQNGQLDEALVKLYEKLDHDANFVPAYYTLGKTYANLGNLAEAQTWCEKAIQKDKLHAEPYYILSMVYQEHGLIDQALEALKRAVYLDRDFILAHYSLAQIYQRQGDKLNARRTLQNVLRLIENRPRDEVIPDSDGMLVGRLRELVDHSLASEPEK